MSGSDRDKHSPLGLIFSALVVIVAIGLYWSMFYDAGYNSGYHERQAYVEREHHASDTPKQIERKCSAKAGAELRECVAEIVEAERESQRSESDLAAQWKAANWVMWAGVVSGLQLILTLAGLYYVKGTLDATLKAVVDTGKATVAMERQNEIAEIAQRPWVILEAEITKFQTTQTGIDIWTKVTARNIGKSVAENMSLWAFIVQDSDNLNDAHIALARSRVEGENAAAFPLVPGDQKFHWNHKGMTYDMVRPNPQTGRAEFLIFATARYSIPGDPIRRVTERAFSICEGDIADPFEPHGIVHPPPQGLELGRLVIHPAGHVRAT